MKILEEGIKSRWDGRDLRRNSIILIVKRRYTLGPYPLKGVRFCSVWNVKNE